MIATVQEIGIVPPIRIGDAVKYYVPTHAGPTAVLAYVAEIRDDGLLDLWVVDARRCSTYWAHGIAWHPAGEPGSWGVRGKLSACFVST